MTSLRDKLYVIELGEKAVTLLVIRTLTTSSWIQTLGQFLHSSSNVPNSPLTLSRVPTFQTECDLPAGERRRTMDGRESRPRGPRFRWDQSRWALWVGRPECRVFPGCGEGWGTGRTCTGSHFTLRHCSSLFQDWRERVLSSLEMRPLPSQNQETADTRCLRDVCCLSKVAFSVPTTFRKAFSLLLLFLFPLLFYNITSVLILLLTLVYNFPHNTSIKSSARELARQLSR